MTAFILFPTPAGARLISSNLWHKRGPPRRSLLKAADVDWFKRSMLEHGSKFQGLLDQHLEKLIAKLHADLDPENRKGSLVPLVESVRGVKKELDLRIEKTAKEFERSQKLLDDTLKDNFDLDSKTSSLTQFQRAVTETLTRFEKAVDPNGRGTLLSDFTAKLDQLLEDHLSLSDQGALGIFKTELTKALAELRAEVRAVLAAQEVTQTIKGKLPSKGISFEAEAFEIAAALAQARNDVAEAVGSNPGKGSTSKKGDLLYQDGLTGAKIVLECKDSECAPEPVRR